MHVMYVSRRSRYHVPILSQKKVPSTKFNYIPNSMNKGCYGVLNWFAWLCSCRLEWSHAVCYVFLYSGNILRDICDSCHM